MTTKTRVNPVTGEVTRVEKRKSKARTQSAITDGERLLADVERELESANNKLILKRVMIEKAEEIITGHQIQVERNNGIRERFQFLCGEALRFTDDLDSFPGLREYFWSRAVQEISIPPRQGQSGVSGLHTAGKTTPDTNPLASAGSAPGSGGGPHPKG